MDDGDLDSDRRMEASLRRSWIIVPDQERVELVSESGDEDATLRPTIDLIVTYTDPHDALSGRARSSHAARVAPSPGSRHPDLSLRAAARNLPVLRSG